MTEDNTIIEPTQREKLIHQWKCAISKGDIGEAGVIKHKLGLDKKRKAQKSVSINEENEDGSTPTEAPKRSRKAAFQSKKAASRGRKPKKKGRGRPKKSK